jgi:hypothetical protein
MTASEHFYTTCKTFIQQLAQIERHVQDQKIYASFDFGKLSSHLDQYRVWAQANTGVIDAALNARKDGKSAA